MPSNSHWADNPRSASTSTVQVGDPRPRQCLRHASHSGRHGGLMPAGKTVHPTGTAHPRYPTLMTHPTQRCPRVVASKATAR